MVGLSVVALSAGAEGNAFTCVGKKRLTSGQRPRTPEVQARAAVVVVNHPRVRLNRSNRFGKRLAKIDDIV